MASAIGGILFSHLAKPPETKPVTVVSAPAPAPAELVIQIVRDDHAPGVAAAQAEAGPTAQPSHGAAAKPKRLAAKQPVQHKSTTPETRPPAQTAVAAAAAQPITTPPGPPQSLAPPAAPKDESVVVAKLRDATETVIHLPGAVARSVGDWFADDTPPRPPANLPQQNFVNATM